MATTPQKDVTLIDAATYHRPLLKLAETLAQKVYREAFRNENVPSFVRLDLFALVRLATRTYQFLCYSNADDRRDNDCDWNESYTFVSAPLVRTIIDVLYNITLILEDPRFNGPAFRKAGYKKELELLDVEVKRYGGQPQWDAHLSERRENTELAIRVDGFTQPEVREQDKWLTLGSYTNRRGPGGTLTAHQEFLQTFTLGIWREYSAMLHAGFDGLFAAGPYYMRDALALDFRAKIDEAFPVLLSQHMLRAAVVLLCILTELHAYFGFEGADIDERIRSIWNTLIPAFEVKELYDGRYAKLIQGNGMAS